MSIRLISAVWQHADVTANTLLTLLALADYADDNGGSCYPSIEDLARKSRQSVRNTQYSLQRLRENGYISIVEPGGGAGIRNTLQINLQSLHLSESETVQRATKKRCKTRQRNNEEPSEIEPSARKCSSLDSVIKPFAEKLYEAYPRHIGKGAAIKAITSAWKRLMSGEGEYVIHNSDAMMNYLLPKVLAFAKSRAGEDSQFTPYPATWFNQSRYLDGEARVSSETASLFDPSKPTSAAAAPLSAVEKVRLQLRGER